MPRRAAILSAFLMLMAAPVVGAEPVDPARLLKEAILDERQGPLAISALRAAAPPRR